MFVCIVYLVSSRPLEVRELSMDILWHTFVQLPLGGCNTTLDSVLRTITEHGHPRHGITPGDTVM